MRDDLLMVTKTNSAKEFSGRVYGVDAPFFIWIVVPLAAGLFSFVGLMSLNISPFYAAAIGAAPAVFAVAFIIIFVQGRPAGYARDWFSSFLTSGDSVPPIESSSDGNSHDH